MALIWGCVYVAVVLAARTPPILYCLGLGSVLVNAGWLPKESDAFIPAYSLADYFYVHGILPEHLGANHDRNVEAVLFRSEMTDLQLLVM
ncbi:MAG: hypothetical protein GY725_06545 [bacterium]|nr:hypothetical protein [bacterium]